MALIAHRGGGPAPAELAGPVSSATRSFSCTRLQIASAAAELFTCEMMSTPCRSIQSRAMEAAMSGFDW